MKTGRDRISRISLDKTEILGSLRHQRSPPFLEQILPQRGALGERKTRQIRMKKTFSRAPLGAWRGTNARIAVLGAVGPQYRSCLLRSLPANFRPPPGMAEETGPRDLETLLAANDFARILPSHRKVIATLPVDSSTHPDGTVSISVRRTSAPSIWRERGGMAREVSVLSGECWRVPRDDGYSFVLLLRHENFSERSKNEGSGVMLRPGADARRPLRKSVALERSAPVMTAPLTEAIGKPPMRRQRPHLARSFFAGGKNHGLQPGPQGRFLNAARLRGFA